MSYTKFQLICLQNYEIFAVNQSPLPAFLQEAFFAIFLASQTNMREKLIRWE